MTSLNSDHSGGISGVLSHLRSKGIRLWSENGKLRYKAPKGALTDADVACIRASHLQIVGLLEKSSAVRTFAGSVTPRRDLDLVPLTTPQLVHWNGVHARTHKGMRGMARAVRLCGQLDLGALQRAIEFLIDRHEALRIQIVPREGVPLQAVRSFLNPPTTLHDLMPLSERERVARTADIFEQVLAAPLDLAKDSLFAASLIKFSHNEHVLLLAMEHIVSDAVSMNILLRELLTAYRAYVSGEMPSLAPPSVEFLDFAAWQRSTHDAWLREHGAYWQSRLRGCQRVRFPHRIELKGADRIKVPIHITNELRNELRDWARARRTTVAMGVLTAYVALLARWCRVPDVVVRYQSDGRWKPEVQNVVGLFSSALYLRIEIRREDTFDDLLGRVTDEYCNANIHADYSWVDVQAPKPAFTLAPGFNWIPRESASTLSECMSCGDDIAAYPIDFVHPVLKNASAPDEEPFVQFWDGRDGISGEVCFRLGQFSVESMESFARNLLAMIKVLLGSRRCLTEIELS